jgi:hypothetical protein
MESKSIETTNKTVAMDRAGWMSSSNAAHRTTSSPPIEKDYVTDSTKYTNADGNQVTGEWNSREKPECLESLALFPDAEIEQHQSSQNNSKPTNCITSVAQTQSYVSYPSAHKEEVDQQQKEVERQEGILDIAPGQHIASSIMASFGQRFMDFINGLGPPLTDFEQITFNKFLDAKRASNNGTHDCLQSVNTTCEVVVSDDKCEDEKFRKRFADFINDQGPPLTHIEHAAFNNYIDEKRASYNNSVKKLCCQSVVNHIDTGSSTTSAMKLVVDHGRCEDMTDGLPRKRAFSSESSVNAVDEDAASPSATSVLGGDTKRQRITPSVTVTATATTFEDVITNSTNNTHTTPCTTTTVTTALLTEPVLSQNSLPSARPLSPLVPNMTPCSISDVVEGEPMEDKALEVNDGADDEEEEEDENNEEENEEEEEDDDYYENEDADDDENDDDGDEYYYENDDGDDHDFLEDDEDGEEATDDPQQQQESLQHSRPIRLWNWLWRA